MEKRQTQEPIDIRKARILVALLIMVSVVFITMLLTIRPKSVKLEEATGDFGTEKILLDYEIGSLCSEGKVLLVSAADLIPNETLGEYVIVDESTGDIKAVVTDWCRTEYIIVFQDDTKGTLYAIYTDCEFKDGRDVVYYRESDTIGDKTKWCECQRFKYGSEKEVETFPYEEQIH